MRSIKTESLLIFVLLIAASQVDAIQLMLEPNVPLCTVIISSFEPIKVQARFPAIGSKVEGERFRIHLVNTMTNQIEQQRQVGDNFVFRQNYDIQNNTIYDLCFTFITERDLKDNSHIYVGYSAQQHFQNLIGKVTIPSELVNEDNIKLMYDVGTKILLANKVTASHQMKERELEDKLVDLSLHKTSRIISITLIECAVIILSGLYQVFALRKFLIQKNLY